MVVNQNENIGMSLQLIKSDGQKVEENATICYKIFDDTGTIELISEQSAIFNNTTKSYVDTLIPSNSWTNQEVGSYLIVWYVSDTEDDFASVYTEDLQINIDKTKIDRILGLIHHNIYIDQPIYDTDNNLVSARVTIYSDAASVGTANDIIGTYQITSSGAGAGRFNFWKQVSI